MGTQQADEPDPGSAGLDEFDDLLAGVASRRLESEADADTHQLRQFVRFRGGRDPAELGPEEIRAYQVHLVEVKQTSSHASHEPGRVTFWARDPAAKGAARKERHPFSLSGEEFVRRFGLHILPPGFARVRYYEALAQCRELLPAGDSLLPPAVTLPELDDPRRRPSCQ